MLQDKCRVVWSISRSDVLLLLRNRCLIERFKRMADSFVLKANLCTNTTFKVLLMLLQDVSCRHKSTGLKLRCRGNTLNLWSHYNALLVTSFFRSLSSRALLLLGKEFINSARGWRWTFQMSLFFYVNIITFTTFLLASREGWQCTSTTWSLRSFLRYFLWGYIFFISLKFVYLCSYVTSNHISSCTSGNVVYHHRTPFSVSSTCNSFLFYTSEIPQMTKFISLCRILSDLIHVWR